VPTVPRYTRQVLRGAMPAARFNTMDIRQYGFGGLGEAGLGLARALGSMGQEIERERLEDELKLNQINVQNVFADYYTKANAIMYGENGTLRRQGRNALTLVNADTNEVVAGSGLETRQRLEGLEEEMLNRCTNDVEKAMLMPVIRRHMVRAAALADRHEAEEKDVALHEANAAALNAAANDFSVSMASGDVGGADEALRNIKALSGFGSRLRGLDAAGAAGEEARCYGRVISGFILRNAAANLPAALAAKARYGDKFAAADMEAVDAKLGPIIAKAKPQGEGEKKS